MIDKSTFVSVKDYVINYGHNGEHIKLTRSRIDLENEILINFYLTKINLINGESKIENIELNKLFDLFKDYYPELPK